MKRFVFLIVFLLFIFGLSSISAEFNQNNATKWLNDRIVWSQASIEELSFATIVLNSQTGLAQLNNKMDSQTGCFPRGNCNSKDTALATLALKAMNNQISKQLAYLSNSLKATTFNNNEWNIQIVANEAGSCTIKYEENQNGITFNFNENGELTTGGSWINFNQLNGFNFNKALENITITCDFSNAPKISIIKIIGNSYYIIDEQTSENAVFNIKNGCYSVNSNSASCDKESSFYVSWALKKLGSGITTENYLTSNADSDLYYAMLSGISNDQLSSLISRQMQDGSFGSSVYISSFAYDSLENSNYADEKNRAKAWVESQQSLDGKIGTGVKDTAVALYLIYNVGIPTGGDDIDEGEVGECITDADCNAGYSCDFGTGFGICRQQETTQSCNPPNLRCETNLGETSINCPTDCFCPDTVCDSSESIVTCPQDCRTQEQVECGNGRCEVGENEISCAIDCRQREGDTDGGGEGERCGDGFCEIGENSNNCSLDCQPEKKKSLWWLWLIIIILALGAIAFFILTKLKKKGGGETPSYLKPRMPPSYPQQQYPPRIRSHKDEGLENELDKSIKEAQELLKRKK